MLRNNYPMIIAEDLNAKNGSWNSTLDNPRGKNLTKLNGVAHIDQATNTTNVLGITLLKDIH